VIRKLSYLLLGALFIGFFIVNLSSFSEGQSQETGLTPVLNEIIQQVKKEDLEKHLRILTGADPFTLNGVEYRITSRNTFHPDIQLAVEYIVNSLESSGYSVEKTPLSFDYAVKKVAFENLTAQITGDLYPDEFYILVANYDSCAGLEKNYDPLTDPTPGADDGATGITVVLALAKIFKNYHFNYSIEFLFTGGHEQGLWGGRYYAMDAVETGKKIKGAIYSQRLGPEPKAKRSKLKIIYNNHGKWSVFDPSPLARTFLEVNGDLTFGIKPILIFSPQQIAADFIAFWEWGIPAVVVGDFSNSNYHTFKDKPENIDFDFLTEATRIIGAAAAYLAEVGK